MEKKMLLEMLLKGGQNLGENSTSLDQMHSILFE